MIGISGGSITNRYVYDGDGKLVLSVENNLRIIKLGTFEVSWNNSYCVISGTFGLGQFNTNRSYAPPDFEWKTYYGTVALDIQNSLAVGDSTGDGTHYLLQDNLGSNSEIIEPYSYSVQHMRFSAWGFANYSVQPTDNQYTGQDKSSNSGLLFYQSRWYDPSIMRWLQPDTVIPDIYNPLDWDRFAYVRNNPVNFNDPSGHIACEDSFYGCGTTTNASNINGSVTYWKWAIISQFGIIMSDAGDKKWDSNNLSNMNFSLVNIDDHLNGHLNSMVHGATFKLNNHSGGGLYNGETNINKTKPTGIVFKTTGDMLIPHQNINHEVGHLLDNTPGTWDTFTNAVAGEGSPSWIEDQMISRRALNSVWIQNDPSGLNLVEARQTYSGFGPSEQWADAFANYVADNIDLSTSQGSNMFVFVTWTLWSYIR